LKPGGVLLLTEGDFQLYDHQKNKQGVPIEGEDGSWIQRILFEAYHVMKERGSSMDAGKMLHTYIQRSNMFDNAGYGNIWCSIGPWENASGELGFRLRTIGTLMRQNLTVTYHSSTKPVVIPFSLVKEFVRAVKPVLSYDGYPETLVTTWIARADRQLDSLHPHLYTKWHYAWATRKLDLAESSAECLPQPPPTFFQPWPLPDLQIG